jgi:nucleoside-diphosphate-sugar epimerase
MKNENVYIIGGSGFIGSHTAKLLIEKEYNVNILDIKSPDRNIYDIGKINYIKCDITDINQVKKSLEGDIDYIIFLAGIIRPEECRNKPYESSNVNITGLLNVLNTIINKNITKFIFSSTTHIYNTDKIEVSADLEINSLVPQHIYPCFKLITEQLLRSYNLMYDLPYLNLRYSVAYGEYGHSDNVINKFIINCLKNESLILHNNGKFYRDFLHVSQHAEANYLSILHPHKNDTLCVGGEFINLLKVAEIIKKLTQSNSKIILTNEGRKNDYRGKIINSEKTFRKIQWINKMPFEKGIEKTINFYKN